MIVGVFELVRRRRRETIWFLGIPILSSLVIIALYETGGRFLVPLYGLLYALASFV